MKHLYRKNFQFSKKTSHFSRRNKAFQLLKDRLTANPCSSLPKPGAKLYLYTDASDVGLEADLVQRMDEGDPSVIAFASRVLRPAERNYTGTKNEFLAVGWACERFRIYFIPR